MSTRAALQRRVDRLRNTLPKQDKPFTSTPEWALIRSVIVQTITAYPEAERAVMPILAHIESIQGAQWQAIRGMLTQALNPFLDAKLAVAQALRQERDI
jgi:hypothetical protein